MPLREAGKTVVVASDAHRMAARFDVDL